MDEKGLSHGKLLTLWLFRQGTICLLALLQCCLCNEFAGFLIDHDSCLVVVHCAFFACCVQVFQYILGNCCLVAFRLLGASVEFVFYSTAKSFDILDGCRCLGICLQNDLDIFIRGLCKKPRSAASFPFSMLSLPVLRKVLRRFSGM